MLDEFDPADADATSPAEQLDEYDEMLTRANARTEPCVPAGPPAPIHAGRIAAWKHRTTGALAMTLLYVNWLRTPIRPGSRTDRMLR